MPEAPISSNAKSQAKPQRKPSAKGSAQNAGPKKTGAPEKKESASAAPAVGLTPERQHRRHRRRMNRQAGLRFVIPSGLLYVESGAEPDQRYRVLEKTPHLYTITESRENLARERFERLCLSMGANAALNVTTREISESYRQKVYRRFEIKGIPAVIGEESKTSGAMTRSMAIKNFPNAEVVRNYQKDVREHQLSKRKIRADEGFERMDRSLAQQVLFVIFVVLALLATASYLPW